MNSMRISFGILAMALAVGCGEATSPTEQEDQPLAEPVTVPALISPPVGAIMDNGCQNRSDGIVWDFEWSDVDGAQEFHLYVKGSNASIPVVDDLVVGTRYRHDRPGSYIIGRHQRDWRWRVRARIGTDWQGWSEERTFDVEPLDTDCS